MTIFSEIRAKYIRNALVAYELEVQKTLPTLESVQLRNLNWSWAVSLERSPWARALRARYGIPEQFDSWSTFFSAVPVMQKADLREIVGSVNSPINERIFWRATGGTTAEPLRLPTFRSESFVATLDHWFGRKQSGIDPAERLFLLWGHAHLFGSGFNGALNRFKRYAADRLLGYCRWSAYRLADSDLDKAATALLNSRASYVIGYSSALDRFARVNEGRSSEIHALGLKAVIATAEAFPARESRQRIAKCFGAPVVMEYGSVETGPLAYQDGQDGEFRVFANHYRLDRSSGTCGSDSAELLVTSLFPRALPLMRYTIGDLVVAKVKHDLCGLSHFEELVGRSNEFVLSPSGTPIHSEAFSHVLRDFTIIESFQIKRDQHGVASVICYESGSELGADMINELRRRLDLIDPGLRSIRFQHVASLKMSIAGKRPMVINSSSLGPE